MMLRSFRGAKRSLRALSVCCTAARKDRFGQPRLLAAGSSSALYPAALLKRPFASSPAAVEDIHHADESVGPAEVPIEDQYTRKTPLEHILLRPGMYIGTNERMPPQSTWVLDPPPPFPSKELLENPRMVETNSALPETAFSMVKREYGVVPALIKVFDEILVNASDNRLRHKSCSRIDVIIDPGSDERDPFIRVFNDGKGIPIQIHKDENMYLPELLFGHLLTGSNFNDDDKRITGGRHGYGAKLTNIFSKAFMVETLDSGRKKYYRQSWSNNMTESFDPEIYELAQKEEDYTCISFVPDIARLSNDPTARVMSPEDYAVMCRRVVDVAGCAAGALRVTLNGVDVSASSFADYTQLYRGPDAHPVLYQTLNSRWTVGVGLSESGSFESVSFVNGMSTHRGGTHINALVQQLAKGIQEKIEKLDPHLSALVSQGMIRRHLFVACDTLIENPTFDSQMKEYLTSSPTTFGSSYSFSNKFLKSLVAPEEDGGPGIVEDILRVARGRQQANLMKQIGAKKTRRQLLSIPKLEDAHKAGSASGWDCTLILTEGDSAKSLAVAGLEVVGRDRFGVFPLRGKFKNVRDASVTQLTDNEEVKSLCSIIGLDFEKKYDTIAERRELRYGHILLMVDQDADGSHIKGLVVNFFRYFWPDLLRPAIDESPDDAAENPPFLSSFVTPLLKAKRKGRKEEIPFYSMADYNAWKDTAEPSEVKKYQIKYYKGLGTSTPAEAKAYFSSFDNHLRPFRWDSDTDGEMLDMVFDKKRAADRRSWILEEYDETNSLDIDPNEGNAVTYSDFVNNELIHFSQADNIRSIPSVIDGLKPSQRKVLYACFKRNLKSELKVAQLTGYCAEQTAYHHGEASLQSTIIGMAQDFVGASNINLLIPSGQFGTRLAGGTDAASPRYIFTHLAPIARHLFPPADDVLLTYRQDDGQPIEPEYYAPVIPLLLVNGSQGIGTGWSTFVPPHNPQDVVDYIRAKLDGRDDQRPPIRPYARGFDGTVEATNGGFLTRGKTKQLSNKSLEITELPLRCWTNNYKQQLLRMRDRGQIVNFVENHTTTKVSFTVDMKIAQLSRYLQSGLEKTFKLTSRLPTTNMNAFDAEGKITKYDSAESMVEAFFPIRMALYQDRKSVLESALRYQATMLSNKAKFIEDATTETIVLGRKSRDELLVDLQNRGYLTQSQLQAIQDDNVLGRRRQEANELLPNNDPEEQHPTPKLEDYSYLLNMPLSSLTLERIQDLRDEATQKEAELAELQDTSAADLWRRDLDQLETML